MQKRIMIEATLALSRSLGSIDSTVDSTTDSTMIRFKPLIETLIDQSPFPRGKLGVSLRAVSSKAPEQVIDGPAALRHRGW